MRFLVFKKKKLRQHILNEKTGRSYCQVENNGKKTKNRLRLIDNEDRHRKLCGICLFLIERAGQNPPPIPPSHKPSSRIDHPPAKFTTQDDMFPEKPMNSGRPLQTLPPGKTHWTVPPWEYETTARLHRPDKADKVSK